MEDVLYKNYKTGDRLKTSPRNSK